MRRSGHSFWRDARGLTLVELTVVILLIGVIMGVAIPSLTTITRAQLKVSAQKVSGAVRFAYDLAARKNANVRLVFDFDEKTFWLEATTSRFLLEKDKDEVRDGAISGEASENRKKRFVTRGYIESGDMWQPKGPPAFSALSGPLSPKVALPDGVVFQDVWVAHQGDRVTSGKAYLYFFPTGMTERAVIHLADDDESVYTIWVEALTGRAQVLPRYVEAPEE